mmetsp:Transcript_63431/g.205988  ORF Transcript_63431/g.205988 Transcript_63431/m.205988 type:complete len:231 (+) Transcript_63431:450-1142(+)
MSLPRWRSMVRRAKYGATQTRPRRGRLSQTFLSHGATGRRRKPPWRVMTSQMFSTTWSHRPSCLRLPHRPQPFSSRRLFRRRRCTLRLWAGRRCLLIRWRRPMLSSGQLRTASIHRCSRTMGSNNSSSSNREARSSSQPSRRARFAPPRLLCAGGPAVECVKANAGMAPGSMAPPRERRRISITSKHHDDTSLRLRSTWWSRRDQARRRRLHRCRQGGGRPRRRCRHRRP